jgi:hypothetical protein
VAIALTDTIIIALDRADGNDERALKTFELAGPTSQFAIVSPSCNWDREPIGIENYCAALTHFISMGYPG